MSEDPRRSKKSEGFTVFFAFLGSTSVKAVRKMLVKLTPGHALTLDQMKSVKKALSVYALCQKIRHRMKQALGFVQGIRNVIRGKRFIQGVNFFLLQSKAF